MTKCSLRGFITVCYVFSSVPVPPTQRPESVCERWRSSLIEHYGGKPEPQQYLPQCEPDGQFRYRPHTSKVNQSGEFIIINNVLCCASVPSSVTVRPPTAGVWTRTDGRSPGPAHMMLSNLHVGFYCSIAASLFTWCRAGLCFQWWLKCFLLCPNRPSICGPAHSAPIATPWRDPASKRWHHAAVRSGPENRSSASQRDQAECSSG